MGSLGPQSSVCKRQNRMSAVSMNVILEPATKEEINSAADLNIAKHMENIPHMSVLKGGQKRKMEEEVGPEKEPTAVQQPMSKCPELGRVYAGTVVKVAPFGVYIKLEGLIDNHTGFLHIQQMLRNGRTRSVWDMDGKRVFVKVHNMRDQELTLSMRDVDQKSGQDLRPTAAGVAPRFLPDRPLVGHVYVGKVLKWNTRGCTMRLEGLQTHWQGLLFKSELFSAEMKIDDKVYVLVTSVVNRKVLLSMQAVDQETGVFSRKTNDDQRPIIDEVPVAKRARTDGFIELQVEGENTWTMYEDLNEMLETSSQLIIPDTFVFQQAEQQVF